MRITNPPQQYRGISAYRAFIVLQRFDQRVDRLRTHPDYRIE
jgi:hypothetical protein